MDYLKDYRGNLLSVDVNHNLKTKKHQCINALQEMQKAYPAPFIKSPETLSISPTSAAR